MLVTMNQSSSTSIGPDQTLSSVQSIIFDKLSLVFQVIATYQMPVHVVGDFNIYSDCPDDWNTRQLLSWRGVSGSM